MKKKEERKISETWDEKEGREGDDVSLYSKQQDECVIIYIIYKYNDDYLLKV